MSRTGDRVELFKGDDDQWYFRRVAANNEIVSDSEGYENFGDAKGEATRIYADVPVFVRDDDDEWAEID